MLYKLLSINESDATRTLRLESTKTKTIDTCFDDSALVSLTNNFDFMEIGKEYDCKIKLFGKLIEKRNEKSVDCIILEENIKVGNCVFVEIKVNADILYIYQEKVEDYLEKKNFIFEFSRKDLIQVDDVIHEDLQ
ncbi:hypothetical protein ACWTCW_05045 [Listeria ivanovii subsp. ivanovii]